LKLASLSTCQLCDISAVSARWLSRSTPIQFSLASSPRDPISIGKRDSGSEHQRPPLVVSVPLVSPGPLRSSDAAWLRLSLAPNALSRLKKHSIERIGGGRCRRCDRRQPIVTLLRYRVSMHTLTAPPQAANVQASACHESDRWRRTVDVGLLPRRQQSAGIVSSIMRSCVGAEG
jgi:hypothetical protein